jgi:hypothetical protein
MKSQRTFITDKFLDKIRTTGLLAEAMRRMESRGSAEYEPLPRISTWGLVCEEIVDTEHRPEYYERCVAELRRRGLSDNTINEMRNCAWRTAGWFNFEKMVWDWCALDEDDIRIALEWQEDEGEITANQRMEMETYVNRYDQKTGEPPGGGDGRPAPQL